MHSSSLQAVMKQGKAEITSAIGIYGRIDINPVRQQYIQLSTAKC